MTKTHLSTHLSLNHDAIEQIGKYLSHVLSDTYVLYVKTQNFHWNVVDPRFFFLHEMLDKQYHELADAVDELAERLRAIGLKAPGSLKEFLELSFIEDSPNDLDANTMLHILVEDHITLANRIRPRISEIQKLGDEGTADLFIERVRYHEKTGWMLKSHFIEG
jgi:starvation-inducible DNA-binding protein